MLTNAVDRLELLDPAEQLAREAPLAGTEKIDDVASKLKKVGQTVTVAGYARPAK